ncbi:MAG: AbrB family transcriptional regulator, partial [Lysinibacillus sp.]
MYQIAVVACIALIGAVVFQYVHLPIPWLLGPIVVVMLAQFRIGDVMKWPAIIRNIGLIILGVAIGQQFDVSIMSNAGNLLIAVI